jgi:hypothetical protein
MPWCEPSRPRPDCLTPPKGTCGGGHHADVDADHAVLQRLADAEDAADVAAVEVAGQAEFGGVGRGDGLLPRSRSGTPAPTGRRFPPAHSMSAWRRPPRWARRTGRPGACRPPPRARPWPPRRPHGAHLVQRGFLDQRALVDAVLEAVADLGGATLAANFSTKRRTRRPARRGGWSTRRSGRRCGTCWQTRLRPRCRCRRRRTR